MRTDFKHEVYGQRWQVETVFSMIKRNLGHAVHGRSFHAHNRDIMLNCLTHNAMILRRQWEGILQSTPHLLSDPRDLQYRLPFPLYAL